MPRNRERFREAHGRKRKRNLTPHRRRPTALPPRCKITITMNPSLLQLTSIHKSFPGCTANDDVNLSINAGEVHALFGENGAGKSTLVKIIYGVLKATEMD